MRASRSYQYTVRARVQATQISYEQTRVPNPQSHIRIPISSTTCPPQSFAASNVMFHLVHISISPALPLPVPAKHKSQNLPRRISSSVSTCSAIPHLSPRPRHTARRSRKVDLRYSPEARTKTMRIRNTSHGQHQDPCTHVFISVLFFPPPTASAGDAPTMCTCCMET
ncbi:hypothetical protein BDU57DRAFT_87288 [Ampelomyces quisqualis]|uniref:Uncharacterized protein n=1 Tax=Ampelomyces quisqualis TaxID=50730 RepID=A0A6A5QC01_AMPQU|nr:hypothetical protein BDU57DRAFT_87288 [Ampelomyces quisqualis]